MVVVQRMGHGPLDAAWGGREVDLLIDAAARFYAAAERHECDKGPREEDWPDVIRRSRAALRELVLPTEQRWNAALKALGGEMLLRMWPRDEEERVKLLAEISKEELARVFTVDELVTGDSALFCATGLSDSALLPGVKLVGKKAITHSILMRAKSRTVRYLRAVHDLETKTIHLRSSSRDQRL